MNPELARLVVAMRAAKVTDRSDLERRLGRNLDRLERRALVIATDSVASPDGMKRQHADREARILGGRTVKHATNRKGTKAIQSLPREVRFAEAGMLRDERLSNEAAKASRGKVRDPYPTNRNGGVHDAARAHHAPGFATDAERQARLLRIPETKVMRRKTWEQEQKSK